MAFFVWKGVKKTTRPNVIGPYRLETGRSTKQTKAIDRRINLVPFFQRVEPFKTTFEHHTCQHGANRCFEWGRADVHLPHVRRTGTRLLPKTNGNTPQPSIHTRDLRRFYSPCGADERAQRRTVATVAVEVDENRWTKLSYSAVKSSWTAPPPRKTALNLHSMHAVDQNNARFYVWIGLSGRAGCQVPSELGEAANFTFSSAS